MVRALMLVALSQVMPAASPDSSFVGLAEEQDAEVTLVGDSLAREAGRMRCSGRSLPRWPAGMGQGRGVVWEGRWGEPHSLVLGGPTRRGRRGQCDPCGVGSRRTSDLENVFVFHPLSECLHRVTVVGAS